MSGADAKPILDWEDGARGAVPVSRTYRDPYYARSDGLAEARHVFLDGNELARRWSSGSGDFTIAELGFGTGLNTLAAWHLWRRAGRAGTLRVVSFEIAPMAPEDMARALSAFPEIADLSSRLVERWKGVGGRHDLGDLTLDVVEGDVRETLHRWHGAADSWFLDGFAPARNPEMWGDALLSAVAERTRPGGTVATYSAAGHVRRGLAAAGFDIVKRPGFGAKREMCSGRLRDAPSG